MQVFDLRSKLLRFWVSRFIHLTQMDALYELLMSFLQKFKFNRQAAETFLQRIFTRNATEP